MPVFPILRLKSHILHRFLKKLRRRATARLQLWKALDLLHGLIKFKNLTKNFLLILSK